MTALSNGRAMSPVAPAELVVHRKVVPSWAIRIFIGALLFAPFVAMIDALARLRRHHESIAPWLRWIAAGALPLVAAAVFARLLGIVGLVEAPRASVARGVPAAGGRAHRGRAGGRARLARRTADRAPRAAGRRENPGMPPRPARCCSSCAW